MTEVGAILASTEVPMRSTRSYSGEHAAQCVMHRGLYFRIERAYSAYQNFEWVPRNRGIRCVRWHGQPEKYALAAQRWKK